MSTPPVHVDDVVRVLGAARSVALACHVGPDGDALGSMLALGLALRDLGKDVVASWGGEPFEVPATYAYLPGLDLLAAVGEALVVAPGERTLVPTGLLVAVPPGHELQIRPRSGLALRHGIVLPNSPGTIDEDYRGELQVIVMKLGGEAFRVERGMRIAQAVLAPVTRAVFREVAALDGTARGGGGFGSTGTVSRN